MGEGLCATCSFRDPIYLWLCQFEQVGVDTQQAGCRKSMEDHR